MENEDSTRNVYNFNAYDFAGLTMAKGNRALAAATEKRARIANRRADRNDRLTEKAGVEWAQALRRAVLLSAESPDAFATNQRRILAALNTYSKAMQAVIGPQLDSMLSWGYGTGSKIMADSLTAKQKREALTEDIDPRFAGELNPTSKFAAPAGAAVRKTFTTAQLDTALFPPISAKRADFLVRFSYWGDKLTWEQRISGTGRHFNFRGIANELTQGIADGDNVAQLTRKLSSVVDGPIYKARRIARTESLRVAELGQRESWRHVEELIDTIEVIATLDEVTRPHHRERDGRQYHKQEDGLYVADNGDPLPQLPDEPNCRCFAAPVIA